MDTGFFWSLLCYLVFNFNHVSLISLIRAIFPISFNQYWFITVYFFMYCLIPFLNAIIDYLDNTRKQLYFLVTGLIIMLANCPYFFGQNGIIGSNLLIFCFVYCLGGLIHKANLLNNYNMIHKSNLVLIGSIFLAILGVTLSVLLALVLHKFILFKLGQTIISANFSYLVLFIAIGVFIRIGSRKINYNFMINKVASLTLGIYLVSDNDYVRNELWINLLHLNHLIDKSPILILLSTIFFTRL